MGVVQCAAECGRGQRRVKEINALSRATAQAAPPLACSGRRPVVHACYRMRADFGLSNKLLPLTLPNISYQFSGIAVSSEVILNNAILMLRGASKFTLCPSVERGRKSSNFIGGK